MKLDLEGKLALVTGATGDIGRACVDLLVAEGARVRLSGRDEARLQAVQATSDRVELVAGDLREASTIERLVPEGDAPDIVIHAAGHRFHYAKLHAEDDADVAALHEVDYEAFMRIARRAAGDMMMKRFGRFVAITSLSSHLAGPGAIRYAAMKAALEGAVRGLAVDYGRFGITANAIAPGFTLTARQQTREGDSERLTSATSLRRMADPSEIAAPAVFLCSPRASYITGATLLVSGGLHLSNAW
jgi:3-oxoacyl-[acyl-carrier protein] reductase